MVKIIRVESALIFRNCVGVALGLGHLLRSLCLALSDRRLLLLDRNLFLLRRGNFLLFRNFFDCDLFLLSPRSFSNC